MIFKVITIFPEIILAYARISIIARSIKKKIIKIDALNLRDFATDAHRTVDGRPYGGGFGMLLRFDILYKAIKKAVGSGLIVGKKAAGSKTPASQKNPAKEKRVILLTPQGKLFKQADAKRLAKYKELIFISSRYEGFDERVSFLADEQFSIGDYVLMGGELPALVMIEAIARFVPGVVGKQESVKGDTFSEGILEYPQYTRPEVLKIGAKTLRVPKVLLSGDHQRIQEWRKIQALKRTKKQRPDLIQA